MLNELITPFTGLINNAKKLIFSPSIFSYVFGIGIGFVINPSLKFFKGILIFNLSNSSCFAGIVVVDLFGYFIIKLWLEYSIVWYFPF